MLSRVSMLWPSLVVVVCGAIFLRLEMRRRRLTLCGRRDQRNSESADGQTVSCQATGVAVAASDGADVRPGGGRMTGSGRDIIARRLPASRGQYLKRHFFSIFFHYLPPGAGTTLGRDRLCVHLRVRPSK